MNTASLPDTDFETGSEKAESTPKEKTAFLIAYFISGVFFGILLIKAEVASWYRIQEMFRFQSFHMYGVIGSAVVTGMISVWLINKFQIKSITHQPVEVKPRKFHKGTMYGGLLFGFGWALTGACPGPLFALAGTGAWVMMISLISAVAGTWVYGVVREKLPH